MSSTPRMDHAEAAWRKYREGCLAVRASKSDFLAGFEAALSVPAADEGGKPWGIVRKGSDGDVAIYSPKFNSVKARFTAGNALRSGEMLYTTPLSNPRAVSAETLLAALKPFAELGLVILGEAPQDASKISIFTDCEGHRHFVSLNDFRAATEAVGLAGAIREGRS